ncbi:hypothetical protein A8F94_05250 [Bacillus sp. FJAT-27225]|uniref:PilW family protein n=1 Tax=Bacillus sp. FJAT-27225 TaxID=1743144 RepID=UPI00080C281C|nr:type II secretion system protein [Bacillus sp. FJAT-27225]OCA91268.1 hypothetical protein A8F94_05250 [Bacillus sp. FJAT-27225]
MKNEKGITLIELLAAIAILSIVSSLVFGVLISSNKNYTKLSAKTDLSREANLIIATIKDYHLKKTSYILDYKDVSSTEKRAYIGSSTPDIDLTKKNLNIKIKVGKTNGFEGTFPLTVDTKEPLYIHLELRDKNVNKPYIIETVIKRY